MKIIFLPAPLREVVHAAGINANHITRVVLFRDIASSEDVGFYVYANSNLAQYVPEAIAGSFQVPVFDYTHDVSNPIEVKYIEDVKRHVQSWTVNGNAPVLDTSRARLTSDLFGDDQITLTHITVNEPDFDPMASDVVAGVLTRLANQLYILIGLEKLAALPVFSGYLAARQRVLTQAA